MSERVAATVIVMAKAPVAGYAKTRLAPALGADGAARLAQRFLAETVGQALAAGIGPVEVCCAPDARHAAFAAIASNGRVVLTEQGEGDLGERMARAMQRALTNASRVILVGTDAPALDAPCLRAACAALAAHDAVFAPTLDGGYALIGLRVPGPALFENMPWGTGRVMAITRERLALAGLGHAELATLADVDEPADLAHVPPAWL